MLGLVILTVATALVFDFTNGFHDTANAMATTIATRALRPRIAVALAAVLNLIGAFLSVAVAATIASGIVDQTTITVPIIFAGLVGAIVWNVITWYMGIPSSSSHALVGGVIGSVLAAEGSAGVIWSGVGEKVLIPALIAPFVCGVAAFLATRLAYRLTRSLSDENSTKGYRCSQILSSSLVALAHGTNDAQKTMGVIVLTLVAGGELSADAGVPMWVKVTCAVAVALGTFSGGWRVIRTLGTKVTDIAAPQGFSAETASSTTILASSFFGFSLSTTQVVSGGVMGAGSGSQARFRALVGRTPDGVRVDPDDAGRSADGSGRRGDRGSLPQRHGRRGLRGGDCRSGARIHLHALAPQRRQRRERDRGRDSRRRADPAGAGDRMTIFSFSEVLPLSDLAQIIVVVLAVAVIAPSAVSMGVVGLDRRDSGSTRAGNAMIAGAVAVLLVLVALGLAALVDR